MSILTTTPLKAAPAAATGVTTSPGSPAWTYGAWVQVIASAAADLAIAGISLTMSSGSFANVDMEFQVGVGAASAETGIGTIRLFSVNTASPATPNVYMLPIPMGGIVAGNRVSIRFRYDGTSATPIATLLYYEGLSSDQATTLAQAYSSVPIGAAGVSVTISASAWTDSAWVELTSGLANPVNLLGLSGGRPGTTATDYEIDLGTGAAGSETVITTLRGGYFGHGTWLHHDLLPTPYYLPASTRVALRVRRSVADTSTSTKYSLIYTVAQTLPTTNLKVHVDASAADDLFKTYVSGGPHTGVPVDGDTIAVWDDEHGANRIFKQNSTDALPVWRATTPLLPLPCLDFAGGQRMVLTNNVGTTLPSSDIISNSAFTVLMAVYVESVTLTGVNIYDGHALIGDSGSYWGLFIQLVSGVPKLSAYNWDGTLDAATLTITTNAPHVVMMRHQAGTLYLSIDGGAETSVASGNTTVLTNPVFIGKTYSFTGTYEGRLGEIAVYDTALTGTDLTSAVSYFTTKWLVDTQAVSLSTITSGSTLYAVTVTYDAATAGATITSGSTLFGPSLNVNITTAFIPAGSSLFVAFVGPVTARVTQTSVESFGLDAATPTARVTQVSAEAFGFAVAPLAHVTQVSVEVFGIADPPPPVPDGDGYVPESVDPTPGDTMCGARYPLFWCEIRIPGTTSTDTDDVANHSYSWTDQPINEATIRREGRIVGIEGLEWALSDFQGRAVIASGKVTLVDYDGALRILIRTGEFKRTAIDFFMVDDDGRRLGDEPFHVGQGLIYDYACQDFLVSFLFEDRLGGVSAKSLYAKPIPFAKFDTTFNATLPKELDGKYQPLAYGLLLDNNDYPVVQVHYTGTRTWPCIPGAATAPMLPFDPTIPAVTVANRFMTQVADGLGSFPFNARVNCCMTAVISGQEGPILGAFGNNVTSTDSCRVHFNGVAGATGYRAYFWNGSYYDPHGGASGNTTVRLVEYASTTPNNGEFGMTYKIDFHSWTDGTDVTGLSPGTQTGCGGSGGAYGPTTARDLSLGFVTNIGVQTIAPVPGGILRTEHDPVSFRWAAMKDGKIGPVTIYPQAEADDRPKWLRPIWNSVAGADHYIVWMYWRGSPDVLASNWHPFGNLMPDVSAVYKVLSIAEADGPWQDRDHMCIFQGLTDGTAWVSGPGSWYEGYIAGCATWGPNAVWGANGTVDADGNLRQVHLPASTFNTDIAMPNVGGTLWTPSTKYALINGTRHTVIYLRPGSIVGEAFKAFAEGKGAGPAASSEHPDWGAVPVHVAMGGIEQKGDGTEAVITSLVRQVQHLVANFVEEPHRTDADWFALPLTPDPNSPYSLIDNASVEAVRARSMVRVPPAGYEGATVIGHDLEGSTFGDVMQRFALAGDFDYFINRHGQLVFSMEEPRRTPVRAFTIANILKGTYRNFRDTNKMTNAVVLETFKNFMQTNDSVTLRPTAPEKPATFLVAPPRRAEDSASIIDHGGDPSGRVEYAAEDWMTRDPTYVIPDDVVAHILRRRRIGLDFHQFSTDLCGLDVQPGDVFTVQHDSGIYQNEVRSVRCTMVKLNPPDPFKKSWSVELIGYDVTDLPDV